MRGIKKISLLTVLLLVAVIAGGCTIKIGGSAITIGGGAKGADGGVWKSTNSGQTWQQVVAVPTTEGKVASIANLDIRRMTFDPQDYDTIYLSTEKDGVVYTNDAGASWRQFNQFAGKKIRSVAVDPQDKCNLYTLDANKMLKSTDCGRFWQELYFHQNPAVILTDVAIDQQDPAVVYLTTSAGEVLRSNNGGRTWATVQRVERGVFLDLVIDSRDSRMVYAATQGHGVYQSVDGGNNWLDFGEGLKQYAGSHEYQSLVLDRATPGSLILVSKFGMLKTSNGGESWEVVDLLPAAKKTTIYSAAVNPKNSNEIYYTTRTTLVKSVDGGQTWSSQKLPTGRVANRLIINPDYPNVVYLGAFKE